MLGYYNYTVYLTYIGAITGFVGIKFAMDGDIRAALICLMIAGFCDMFDGKIASTRKRDQSEKNFGIQIDSLSDLMCFGVLPAIICFCFGTGNTFALCTSALYFICALIRLAYFNVDEAERQGQTTEGRMEYRGLPVTSAALIYPSVLLFQYILKLDITLVYFAVMIVMGFLFISDVRVTKPGMKGILVMVGIGLAEFILLILFGGR